MPPEAFETIPQQHLVLGSTNKAWHMQGGVWVFGKGPRPPNWYILKCGPVLLQSDVINMRPKLLTWIPQP